MQRDVMALAPVGSHLSGDEERFTEEGFVRVLQAVGTAGPSVDAVKRLVAQILLTTSSQKLRDAAAMALVDLEARDEADALLRVIERPELSDHIGTLIFAFSELGASMPLKTVVHIVERGSYEAKAETILLVEAARVAVPDDAAALQSLTSSLTDLQRSANEDVSTAAAAVLSALG